MIRKADTILIADDEPYNLQWVVEFLESLGYKTKIAESVDDAIREIKQTTYRAVIADLSIPLLPPQSLLEGADPLYKRYPGLLVAASARSYGHTDRQVIVYSVHNDPMVKFEADRLRVTYLLKGRPRTMKEELRDVLSYDPLAMKS